MTDDNNTPENTDETHDVGTVPQTPVVIHAQYLKDMSFENPNAPEILQKANKPPEVDINIAVDARKLENTNNDKEHFYEVILTVNANAKRDGKTLFLAEIKYGASVSIHGIDEKQHHAILFVEVPRMIFPFVRLILANATQAGAFTPLQMALVDFHAMYKKRFAKKINDAKNAKDKENA